MSALGFAVFDKQTQEARDTCVSREEEVASAKRSRQLHRTTVPKLPRSLPPFRFHGKAL